MVGVLSSNRRMKLINFRVIPSRFYSQKLLMVVTQVIKKKSRKNAKKIATLMRSAKSEEKIAYWGTLDDGLKFD